MGYTVQRNQLTRFTSDSTQPNASPGIGQALMQDLMQAGGLTKVFPTGSISNTTTVAVFDSNAATDPLADSDQKWRIRVEATANDVRINVATALQIPGDGSKPSQEDNLRTSGSLQGGAINRDFSSVFDNRIIKALGSEDNRNFANTPLTERKYLARKSGVDRDSTNLNDYNTDFPFLIKEYFYPRPDQSTSSAPLSYRLVVSDHGISFCIWKDGADDDGSMFAWFVVQRPVDPTDGTVLTEYYSPVFCVYSVGGGGSFVQGNQQEERMFIDGIQKFVVRESDVYAPTLSRSASVATEDSGPIINPMRQVAISVDNKYMVTFPSGLNTQRRAYKHELDMLAYTSADVISQDSDVDLTVFGEQTPRTYKAMQANRKYNTGMRILLLTHGGGAATEGTTPTPEEPTN